MFHLGQHAIKIDLLYLRLCLCTLSANRQPYWQRLFSHILLTISQICYL